MMQITTHSADETQALGQKLASRLAPGDVIAYFGDLGAGKTAFTRGLAQGLGITDPVTSPRRRLRRRMERKRGRCSAGRDPRHHRKGRGRARHPPHHHHRRASL